MAERATRRRGARCVAAEGREPGKRSAFGSRPALDLGFSGRLGEAASSPIAHVSLGRSVLRC
jgi:hypothetical protein